MIGTCLMTEEGAFDAPDGYVFTWNGYYMTEHQETGALAVMTVLKHASTGAEYIGLFPVNGGEIVLTRREQIE